MLLVQQLQVVWMVSTAWLCDSSGFGWLSVLLQPALIGSAAEPLDMLQWRWRKRTRENQDWEGGELQLALKNLKNYKETDEDLVINTEINAGFNCFFSFYMYFSY